MPSAASKPCKAAYTHHCPALVTNNGYCAEHAPIGVQIKHEYEQAKGSAHSRGYGHEWRKRRARILKRDPICKGGWDSRCGGRNLSYHCDHIVRKEDGGTDLDSNLQGLCAPCHHMKTSYENAGRPLPPRQTFFIP